MADVRNYCESRVSFDTDARRLSLVSVGSFSRCAECDTGQR